MSLRRGRYLLIVGQRIGSRTAVRILALAGTDRTFDAPGEVPVGPQVPTANHYVSAGSPCGHGLRFRNLRPSNGSPPRAASCLEDLGGLRGALGLRHELAFRSMCPEGSRYRRDRETR